MRAPTPHAEVRRLIDAYLADDKEVYCTLAYALANAATDNGPLLAFVRHGKVWTASMGMILVRELVPLEDESA